MSSSQPPAVDLAEVASEVVRVMHEDGLSQYAATNVVMTRRKLHYGHALEIASLANEAFQKLPHVADHVRRGRKKGYVSLADAQHHVQAAIEDRAPVFETFNPRFAG